MRAIEAARKIKFNEDFDCYVGTSVGGLISVCLASGLAPEEIYEIFSKYAVPLANRKAECFPKWIVRLILLRLVRALFKRFQDIFEKDLFGKISNRVFLPVFDLTSKENTYFGRGSPFNLDDVPTVDILRAICSDLRLSKPFTLKSVNKSFCDAGIFAYDPVAFLIRSLAFDMNEKTNILSIGSGVIENLFASLNVGYPFDDVYDSFLREQFEMTKFLFAGSGKMKSIYYVRISEFPTLKRVNSLEGIVELAEKRFLLVDEASLAVFRR